MTDEPQADPPPKKARRRKATKTPRPSKAATPPWVADPNALEVVGTAARAVGLTVEDLANLIVDAGITALPPSDGITSKYTLKDLGTRLWGTMQQEPRHMRAQWFGGLAPTQKIAVIVTLREQGFSSMAISGDFKIPVIEVNEAWNRHADDIGAQVVGTRLNTIAGNLQIMAERATQGAMEANDYAAMWRIQKELTKILADIGIVERASQKIEVTHKFDEQKAEEIKRLVEIEEKRRVSMDNIKRIEATVIEGDPLPEEMRDDTG